MKVLVATSETQGQSKGRVDFFWADEGELLKLPATICANPTCGCGDSLNGLDSQKSTTTFKIKDSGIDEAGLRELIMASYKAGGWWQSLCDEKTDETMAFIRKVTAAYSAGTVLEMPKGVVGVRS